jgi:hypothetical protein
MSQRVLPPSQRSLLQAAPAGVALCRAAALRLLRHVPVHLTQQHTAQVAPDAAACPALLRLGEAVRHVEVC